MKDLTRLAIYERDNGICGFCHEPVEWTDLDIDHVVPLIAGGQDTMDNLRAAHRSCNRSANWDARVLHRKQMPAPKVRILLNFPPELAERLRDLAARERRYLSTQIQILVERALADEDREAVV